MHKKWQELRDLGRVPWKLGQEAPWALRGGIEENDPERSWVKMSVAP